MNINDKVIYKGKLHTVFFIYDSGYIEIKEYAGINDIKLVHQKDVVMAYHQNSLKAVSIL